jgi:hypothetical protein
MVRDQRTGGLARSPGEGTGEAVVSFRQLPLGGSEVEFQA